MLPIHKEVDGMFIVNLMASPFFWSMIENNLKGIAYKGLNLGSLREFAIALPPLAEQQRIVAKVDELMTLCDQLKAGIGDVQATQLKLVDALATQVTGE